MKDRETEKKRGTEWWQNISFGLERRKFQVADKIDAKTATVIVKEISTVETTSSLLHRANRKCVLMTRHYPSSGASSIQSKLI